MNILLIVDPQKDFCPGGALAVTEGDQIIPAINQLLHSPQFSLRIASKDYHPADHLSFASQHPHRQIGDVVNLSGLRQVLWPDHCVVGSRGAEFHPLLDQEKIDRIFLKGQNREIDSYSAFYDNARRASTGLGETLLAEANARGISAKEVKITVCGLALDYCVGFSAIDALSLGFSVELALDATRAVNLTLGDDIRMLRSLQALGANLLTTHEILERDSPARERNQPQNRMYRDIHI